MRKHTHLRLALTVHSARAALLAVCLVAGGVPAGAEVVWPAHTAPARVATNILWEGIRRLPPSERPRVVLVLGGGGARGFAHIGVLRVLEQERIPIDEIVGVSVGALIGALYAGGLSVDQIESLASDIRWRSLTDFSRPRLMRLIMRDELLSTERMESYLEERIGEKTFSELAIPFTALATDIRTGERVVFREGSVALAARASATMPGIFRPVTFRHRSLVDGGVVDNFPTDLVPPGDDRIVIGVLPRADLKLRDDYNVFFALVRSIDIQKDAMLETKRQAADVVIQPDVGDVSLIDLSRAEECIDAGVLAARAHTLSIKQALMRLFLKRTDAGEDATR